MCCADRSDAHDKRGMQRWKDKIKYQQSDRKGFIFGIVIFLELSLVLYCFWGMSREKESYLMKEQKVTLYGGEEKAEGVYYIDENAVLQDRIFLSMELSGLKRGVYEVLIDYDTDSEQASWVISEQAGFHRLYENVVSLRPSNVQKEVSYRFRLLENVDDLRAEILYTGNGVLTITDFRVVHTRQEYSMMLFFVLLASLLIDTLFYFFAWNKEKISGKTERKILFGLSVVFLLSCYNLLIDYFHLGDDIYFHVNRIEGIAREWMAGNFPARLESYCMYGMGYPMSIMYPEVFLWPAVLLRIMGFDLSFCLKADVAFINLLTVILSYVSFKNIFNSRQIGVWGSAVYTLAQYRLYNIYGRAALGEFMAMTFLPLICWGLTRVFSEKKETAGDRRTTMLLASGYMGVLYSHVLSVEIVAVFTIVICILFWKRFFRKCTFFTFVKAALLTIGLSLWYLIPFLDYTLSANLNVFEAGNPIQVLGLYLLQLFWFFPWKGGTSYMYVSGMQNVRAYGMGLGLAVVFFCFIYFRIKGVDKRRMQEFPAYSIVRVAAIIGILAMFMSLSIFPWDTLSELFTGLQKAIYSIQFPYRFLVIVTISFSVVGCGLFSILGQKKDGKKGICFAASVLILTILSSSFYLNHEIYGQGWSGLREAAAMGSASIGNGEYLPAETEVSELVYTRAVPGNGVILEAYEKENAHVEFWCENRAGEKSYVECNLLYYPGYQAENKETGELLTIVPGKNNVLRVEIPDGFEGRVAVEFIGMEYWKIGNWISAVLWLAVISFCAVSYGRRRKKQKICLEG